MYTRYRVIHTRQAAAFLRSVSARPWNTLSLCYAHALAGTKPRQPTKRLRENKLRGTEGLRVPFVSLGAAIYATERGSGFQKMSAPPLHACEFPTKPSKRDASGESKPIMGVCLRSVHGLFRSEDACKAKCSSERLELANTLIKKAGEWIWNVNAEGNYVFLLNKEARKRKTFEVILFDDFIRLESGGFSMTLHRGGRSGIPYASIDDLFYSDTRKKKDPWTADDYIAFVKLLAAGAVSHENPDAQASMVIVKISYDVSALELASSRLTFWPWLMLSRGMTYYEARGFANLGIPYIPRRQALIKAVQTTALQNIPGISRDFLRRRGMDLSTTLQEFANKLLLYVGAEATMEDGSYDPTRAELRSWQKAVDSVAEFVSKRTEQCNPKPDDGCEPLYIRRLTENTVRLDVIGSFDRFEVAAESCKAELCRLEQKERGETVNDDTARRYCEGAAPSEFHRQCCPSLHYDEFRHVCK